MNVTLDAYFVTFVRVNFFQLDSFCGGWFESVRL